MGQVEGQVLEAEPRAYLAGRAREALDQAGHVDLGVRKVDDVNLVGAHGVGLGRGVGEVAKDDPVQMGRPAPVSGVAFQGEALLLPVVAVDPEGAARRDPLGTAVEPGVPAARLLPHVVGGEEVGEQPRPVGERPLEPHRDRLAVRRARHAADVLVAGGRGDVVVLDLAVLLLP
jgi:hypothetical protein